MFAGQNDNADDSGLSLSHQIDADGLAAFFDGVIEAYPGTRLLVSAPAQAGLEKAAQEAYAIQSNALVTLILDQGGMFRTKSVARFKFEEEPA